MDDLGRMHMIYFKGDPTHGDVFYIYSENQGQTFTEPLRVNSQPGSALIVGTVRGPRMAIGNKGRVHVSWMGSEKAEPKAAGKSPMLYARLDDTGKAFEPQRNMIDKHPGLDGGGSVAADTDGNVYVAWHAPEGDDLEANRQVWLRRSTDEGKTFDAETAVIPKKTGCCGCCGLTIGTGEGGVVTILFRTATNKVNRDLDWMISKDHGKSFTIVNSDPWRSDVCVMSTSSILRTPAGLIAAWEGEGNIRLADWNQQTGLVTKWKWTPDAGERHKHPSLAVDKSGGILITWADGTTWGKGGAMAWQKLDSKGNPIAGGKGRLDELPAWSKPAAYINAAGRFEIAY